MENTTIIQVGVMGKIFKSLYQDYGYLMMKYYFILTNINDSLLRYETKLESLSKKEINTLTAETSLKANYFEKKNISELSFYMIDQKIKIDDSTLFIPIFNIDNEFIAFFSIIPNTGVDSKEFHDSFKQLLASMAHVLKEYGYHYDKPDNWLNMQIL